MHVTASVTFLLHLKVQFSCYCPDDISILIPFTTPLKHSFSIIFIKAEVVLELQFISLNHDMVSCHFVPICL